MMQVIISSILLSVTLSWQSAYMAFNGIIISSSELNGWSNPFTGTQPSISSCTASGMQYIWLDGTYTIAEISLVLLPSYSVQTIADMYFYYSFDNEYASMWVDGIQIFSQTRNYNSMFQYANICYPVTTYLELYSVIDTIQPHNSNTLTLKFYTNLDNIKEDESVYIRNVQVFIEPCHYTCLTCSGPTSLECTSCYYLIPLADQSCNLCSDVQASFTHLGEGCLSECPSNYLADKDNFCTFDQNLQALSTIYQGTTFANNEMELIQDYRLTYSISIRSLAILCGSQQVTGPLYYQDIQQKFLTISPTTTLLRIRASFYLSQWTDQEQLSLYLNDQDVCQVFYQSGTLTSNNCKITKFSLSEACGTEIYDQVRIELVFHLLHSINSILVQFQASTQLSQSSKWGIRDVTIEGKECSKNCDTCKDQNNCQSCSAGYKLHKGQCRAQCPVYSIDQGVNCEDFDEETDMTKYAIKEFYDMSTDVHTANNMFTLVSQNPPNFGKGAGIYFSYLDNKRIFGGTLVWRNAKFSKTISVTESHYGIRLRMKVILGDAFASGTFKYSVNGVGVTLSRSSVGIDGQIWGAANSDYQIQVNTGLISNSNSGVYIFVVECLASAAINQANCGIADLFVTILQCPFQCDSCTDYNTCLVDKSPLSPGYTNVSGSRACSDGYYIDYQANTCQTCVVDFCNKCSDKYICTECQNGFQLESNGTCQCLLKQFLDVTICKDCHSRCSQCRGISESNCLACFSSQNRILQNNKCECVPYYKESSLGDQCEPICGDMHILQGEECDDGNFNRFDGCHNCKFECQEECLFCNQGKCYKCEHGFVLNQVIHRCFKQQMDEVKLNIQSNFCGNGVVDSKEECDDGNLYPFDGCHLCIKECVDHCSHCVKGICLWCAKNYYLDKSLEECLPTTPQSQVTNCTSIYNPFYNYHQECQNQDRDPYKECPQFCKKCILGQCLQCEDEKGFFLDSLLNQCVYSCPGSDSQIYISNNQILSDCYQNCCIDCKECEYEICQQCETGFQLINNTCISKCGDSIVTVYEECDDGNDQQFDGCYNCKYQCSESCIICIEGSCIECQEGFIIIEQQCHNICGDGTVAYGKEECDDQNLVNGDGCSENCMIENGWTCLIQQLHSSCLIFQAPFMYLESGKDANSQFKIVYIHLSQHVKSISTEPAKFEIYLRSNESDVQEFYILNLRVISQPSYFLLKDIIYEITIIFLQNTYSSQLDVYLVNKNQFINQYNQEVQNNLSQLKLSYTNFVQQSEVDSIDKIKLVHRIIIYTVFTQICLGLLFGGLHMLWNILDLLQFLSYLKYINNPFPENLQSYFDVFDDVSLNALQNLFGFDRIYRLLFGDIEFPFLESGNKLEKYNVNSLFLNNISSVCFIFFVSYLSYQIQQLILNKLNKLDLLNCQERKVWVINLILIIKQYLFDCISQFYYSILLRLLFSSSYDIYFACYLQLSYNLTQISIIITFSLILTIICYCFLTYINLLLFYKTILKQQNLKFRFYFNIQSIFEGTNIQTIFGSQFNCILLIRRNIFMFILILIQSRPLLQPILIAFSGSCFLLYVIYCSPLQNKFESFNVKLTEITVQICCIIFITFEINMNHQQIYSYETYYSLGWFVISLISGNLFFQFILDLYQQILYLKQIFLQQKNFYTKYMNKSLLFVIQEFNDRKNIQNSQQ